MTDLGHSFKSRSSTTSKGLEKLSPLKRRRPELQPHAVVDIESKDEDTQAAGFTRPFLAGFYDGNRTKLFRNDEGVAKLPWQERAIAYGGCIDYVMRHILTRKYQGHRIYAHNGGGFDFLFLVAWLAKSRRYHFRLTSQGPNLLAIRIEKSSDARKAAKEGKRVDQKKVWLLVDSIRLLPMSLKAAAKAFDCETQKMEFDLHTQEDDPRWDEYLRDDLKSLHECMTRVGSLLEELGGEIALTTPSAALKLFQRKYLKQPIVRSVHEPGCHDLDCERCAHDWVRTAYTGGRTEKFCDEREYPNLFYYDINSSYPAAMTYPMPVGPVSVLYEPKREWSYYEDKVTDGEWVGFARCTVFIPDDCNIPPLPMHHPKTGKLVFPKGIFTGAWDIEELKLLRLVPGAKVVGVHRVYMYAAAPVFREMIEALYPLRDKRRRDFDEGIGALVKLLLNALYGKFGQRPEHEEIMYLPDRKAPEGAIPIGGDPFTAMVWTKVEVKDAAHILPQIAAHVTSLGRVRLFYLLRSIEDRGGRVFYCDTDSAIGDVTLPESQELGMIKRENPCPNLVGRFIRPKVYSLRCACKPRCGALKKDIYKAKGIPHRFVTAETWNAFADGEKVSFSRLAKFRTMARGGLKSPSMVHTHKRISTAYDKRAILADGTTRPVTLDESVAAKIKDRS